MTTDEAIAEFRRCATWCGFELLDGDFVRTDGTHSRFHLRPVDGRKLLHLAMQCPPFLIEGPVAE